MRKTIKEARAKLEPNGTFHSAKKSGLSFRKFQFRNEVLSVIALSFYHLRWLNRGMEDHEARASDLNRK